MNKNTKRVLSAITIASLAVVPDGVAPTVALGFSAIFTLTLVTVVLSSPSKW